MILIFAMCWWIAYSEIRTATTKITCTALPIGAVFSLALVCGLNAVVKRLRKALPYFLGLILGDYVIASLWTFVGLALGIDMYRCFPNQTPVDTVLRSC